MKLRKLLPPLLVVFGVLSLVAWGGKSRVERQLPEQQLVERFSAGQAEVVAQVDAVFAGPQGVWAMQQVTPAPQADDYTLYRRLSLALHGTIPSLEEMRLFEADRGPQRIERWTQRLLEDPRFGDYFARRFARFLVGSEDGPFVVFRRDRFWAWLSEQFSKNTPYDQLVRQMVTSHGLWTGNPETNFITVTANENVLDKNKLAGRTVRAFLGQRIDCAQCHDHPFAAWKQGQFEGLAACYGQCQLSPVGVCDDLKSTFSVEDRMTLEKREVTPDVPFHPEWRPAEGTPREKLAAWLTHPENRRFERAIVNRIWGLVTGVPLSQNCDNPRPVDDLPDPPDEPTADVLAVLDILGRDFREHGYDLKRLISTITATRVFRLASYHPAYESGEQLEQVEQTWAAFPLVRLRPEQIIGAMLQASSLKTIDQNSALFKRATRFFRELEFVRQYGDLGDDEFTLRGSTIPQALLRMNGEFARETSAPSPFGASGRISALATTDQQRLDALFLTCLTRPPTSIERDQFLGEFSKVSKEERAALVEDLFWTLFNSAEFCWNH